MRGSDRDLWSAADRGVDAAVRADAMPSGGAFADVIQACLTPTNLAAAVVAAVGWLALLGWSGAGPDGWQARLCAGMEVQPQSCSAVRLPENESRTAATGATS